MNRASEYDEQAKNNSGEFAYYNKPSVLIYILFVTEHSKIITRHLSKVCADVKTLPHERTGESTNWPHQVFID
jgi:hypothetical protein